MEDTLGITPDEISEAITLVEAELEVFSPEKLLEGAKLVGSEVGVTTLSSGLDTGDRDWLGTDTIRELSAEIQEVTVHPPKPGGQHSLNQQDEPPIDIAMDEIGRWMYLNDREGLVIIAATAVAIFLPGTPLWLIVIGPSGGGKTELLCMFIESEDGFVISKMTRNTLMSGLKDITPGDDLIHTPNPPKGGV